MEYDFLNNSLLNKILQLAVTRQTPFIVIQDPKYAAMKAGHKFSDDTTVYNYIATIGGVNVGFDGFSPADLVDLYAELKAGLYAEEAAKHAHEAGWQSAKEAYAKSP
jgi:hypothetical protein